MTTQTVPQSERSPAPQTGMDYFTIGDMARHYEVSLRTLRFYEDRGLLRPVRHGNVRLYDAPQRFRLQQILKGKRLGFTLTQIREMLGLHREVEPAAFEDALEPSRIVSQIESLERQRADLDHAISELRATHARFTASTNGAVAIGE